MHIYYMQSVLFWVFFSFIIQWQRRMYYLVNYCCLLKNIVLLFHSRRSSTCSHISSYISLRTYINIFFLLSNCYLVVHKVEHHKRLMDIQFCSLFLCSYQHHTSFLMHICEDFSSTGVISKRDTSQGLGSLFPHLGVDRIFSQHMEN